MSGKCKAMKLKKNQARKIAVAFIIVLLLVIAVVDLVPLFYMFSSAFKTRGEYLKNIIGLAFG